MRTLLKALKWLAIVVVCLIVVFVAFVYLRADRTYDAPYPAVTASQDPALIARGKYLVYGPAHCADCHAPQTEAARVEAGEEVPLSGGIDFELPIGMLHAPNITPDEATGIGTFTDGEIARTLRYGIKRDGTALLDLMPFYDISERDLTAIISYLRSTEPVHNERPTSTWNFMGKAVFALGLIHPMGDGEVPPAPAEDSTAAYGEYLAHSIANCRGCHTQRDLQTGGYVGPEYAGQFAMDVKGPDGEIKYLVSPNLTPDPETGRIANWTRDTFVARFRAGKVIPESPMPWGPFSRMSDLELVALYNFLQGLDPIRAETPIPVGLLDAPPTAG